MVYLNLNRSATRDFKYYQQVHYCLDLSEMFETDRIVPVVIFLLDGRYPAELTLGGDHQDYLRFRFIACNLARLPAERYSDSDNIVARLNLPNMLYSRKRKVDMYAQALRGLFSLEPDLNKQVKYIDFIDLYAVLDNNERLIYQCRYPDEEKKMKGFVERYIRHSAHPYPLPEYNLSYLGPRSRSKRT